MRPGVFLLLLALLTMLISGCSSTKAAATPTVVPPPTLTPMPSPVPSTGTPSPEGRRGGNLSISIRTPISSFDVHREFSPPLAAFGPGMVYSRLMRFQSGPGIEPPNLLVECDLCSSWVLIDPTTIQFNLRPGVRWQDAPPVNGRELVAQDIVDSYRRQRTPGWPNASLLENIAEIKAVDQRTLLIRLRVPDADLLRALADGHSKVLAPEVFAANPNLKDGPNIGSGPWVWSDTGEEGVYLFLRNPLYFDEGLPYLDSLTVRLMEDEDTRVAAFLTRLLDVEEMPPLRWDELPKGNLPPHLLYPQMSTGIELGINTQAEPFRDVSVRQALFLALDPWRANEEVWKRLGSVTLGVPLVAADWLLPQELFRPYLADTGRARSLLAQSGRSVLSVELTVADFGDIYLDYAGRMEAQLKEAGFVPSLKVLNPREYAEKVWDMKDYQVYMGPTPPFNTTNSYLLASIHSLGGWNAPQYKDQALDRLIASQVAESDVARRRDVVVEIQRLLMEKAVRFMPYTQVQVWAWWPRVKGFYPNFANFEYSFWSRVWVEEYK